MKFNYNGLWKLLIDKNMIKKDLMKKTGISPSTVSKMTKGEPVNMQILWKICTELDSDIGDLVCIDKSVKEVK
jgi:DNA-binding Xre family transcriptional regulator